ncbi:MAG: hypothetical protein ACE5OZ_05255 [Candidatus Heimdallarchaeota archaeon]
MSDEEDKPIKTHVTIMEESEESLLAATEWITKTFGDRISMAQVIGPTFEIHLIIDNSNVPEATKALSELTKFFEGKLQGWTLDPETKKRDQ